jgi:hypothetical protein
MADGYLAIAEIADDKHMQGRVAACVAQQSGGSVQGVDPTQWTVYNKLTWASSPGWGAAWDSAKAAGVIEPGNVESVITDGMILATIQPLVTPIVAPAVEA